MLKPTGQQPQRVRLTAEGIRNSPEFRPEDLRGWTVKSIGGPSVPDGCVRVSWDSLPLPRTVNRNSIQEIEEGGGPVARVLYVKNNKPTMGMLCRRYADGTLIPYGNTQPWKPDEHWHLEKEEPIGKTA